MKNNGSILHPQDVRVWAQTLDITDFAIHGVVCQKSDFHGNSDIQNS
jgi:hypothetical protein